MLHFPHVSIKTAQRRDPSLLTKEAPSLSVCESTPCSLRRSIPTRPPHAHTRPHLTDTSPSLPPPSRGGSADFFSGLYFFFFFFAFVRLSLGQQAARGGSTGGRLPRAFVRFGVPWHGKLSLTRMGSKPPGVSLVLLFRAMACKTWPTCLCTNRALQFHVIICRSCFPPDFSRPWAQNKK